MWPFRHGGGARQNYRKDAKRWCEIDVADNVATTGLDELIQD